MESSQAARHPFLSLLALGLGTVVLAGCADEPGLDTEAQALEVCPTWATDVHKSLVVTEAQTLALFSFQRVMDAVLASVPHDPAQTRLTFFQQWMGTYAPPTCPGPGIDPHGYGLLCPRTREANLAASNPYLATDPDFFFPVALFNRFDLAPRDGAHCGEYRIVFAKTTSDPLDRAFLIFEAVLPNPAPEKGLAACYPVAAFWQELSNLSPGKRALALEEFYFTGIKGFEPAIMASHYGLRARRGGLRLEGYGDPTRPGQIRTNMFPEAAGLTQWNLREFKLDLDCSLSPATEHDGDAHVVTRPLPPNCRLKFEHVTDANNPADELFDNTNGLAASFQAAFVADDVASLAATGGSPACGGGANLIGMATHDDFNEFESIASGVTVFDVEYDNFAVTSFRTAVDNQLATLGSALIAKNIFDRAQTQTCAGCHNRSANDAIGGGITWPASLGFTHVSETSQLSPALLDVFLPFRKCVLDGFIQRLCTDGLLDPADGGLTVGGQRTGAAN